MKNVEAVRQNILDSARKCFSENGYKESTMRDIARVSGISAATIYNYFKNKRVLFDALNIPEVEDYEPTSEKRRQEILSTALILFGEKGYDGLTMDDIASKLRISKATIYQYFSGKEDLFSQVLQNSSFNLYTKSLVDADKELDIYNVIMEVGRRYLSIADNPERTAIFKTVIRDSANFPELGTLYYEQGINPACNNIIEYINAYCMQHSLPLKNITQLRSIIMTYIGSLQSFLLMHSIVRGVPHDVDQETYLKTTTEVFVNYLIQDGYIPAE